MILKSSFLVRFVVVRPSSSSCRFVVSLFFFFFRVLFAQNLFARFQIILIFLYACTYVWFETKRCVVLWFFFFFVFSFFFFVFFFNFFFFFFSKEKKS